MDTQSQKKGTFPCSFAALCYKLFERCETMISTLNTTLDMGLRCHLVDCNIQKCKDLKGSSVSSTTSMPPAMPAPNTGRRYWDKRARQQNFLNNPEDACISYFFEFLWLELAVAAFASCFSIFCLSIWHCSLVSFIVQCSRPIIQIQKDIVQNDCCRDTTDSARNIDLANDFDNLSPGSSLISMLQSRKQRIELFTKTTSWFVLVYTWHVHGISSNSEVWSSLTQTTCNLRCPSRSCWGIQNPSRKSGRFSSQPEAMFRFLTRKLKACCKDRLNMIEQIWKDEACRSIEDHNLCCPNPFCRERRMLRRPGKVCLLGC